MPGAIFVIVYLLEVVGSFNQLAHSPYCAYVQVVVENHDVGILVLLQ